MSESPTAPAPHIVRRIRLVQPRTLAVLAVLVTVYLLSRRALYRAAMPSAPPSSADINTRFAYYLSRVKADASDANAYFQLGLINEQRGYYMAALDRLEMARALGVHDDVLVGPMGCCLLRLARFAEARHSLTTAARLNPDLAEYTLALAELARETNQSGEALRVLQDYLQRHPELAQRAAPAQRADLEGLMSAFVEAGDYKTGETLAQQVIRLAPNEPNGYAVAGRCLLAQQRASEAAALLDQAVQRAPDVAALHYYFGLALSRLRGRQMDALVQWNLCLQLNAQAQDVYLHIGDAYAQRKQWLSAASAYADAVDKTRNGSHAATLAAIMFARADRPVEAAYYRAHAFAFNSKYQEALNQYQAISRRPEPKWQKLGKQGIADMYRLQRRFSEYITLIEQLFPNNTAEDLGRRVDAYADAKQWGKRKKALHQLLAKDPSYLAYVHHELGDIADVSGMRDEAEKEYQQAVQAEPENVVYRRSLYKLYLERRAEGSRLKMAQNQVEEVVRLTDDSAQDYLQLGLIYAEQGNLLRAAQTIEHAIDLQPGLGPAYKELGRLYALIGDKRGSEAMLRLYRQYVAYDIERQNLLTRAFGHPKDAKAQAELGAYYLRASGYRLATQQYEKVVNAAPNVGEYHRILAHLYQLSGRTSDQAEQERLAAQGA